MISLTAAGLTKTEAKCYEALLTKKDWVPSELAQYVNETRTNCYKILDNLVALGLAHRFDKGKKLHYQATNPSRLLELARIERARRENEDQELEMHSKQLTETYYRTQEQPGIRYYQGKLGIKDIFADMVETKKTIYLIRSPSDINFYDEKFFEDFKSARAQAGIDTYALTPDIKSANHDAAADQANRFIRTWLPATAYTGSVEWNVYGDKLAIISYGEEAMGMIIESPQIASSFVQLFQLLSTARGATQPST